MDLLVLVIASFRNLGVVVTVVDVDLILVMRSVMALAEAVGPKSQAVIVLTLLLRVVGRLMLMPIVLIRRCRQPSEPAQWHRRWPKGSR